MFFTIWHSRFGALTQQGKTNKNFCFYKSSPSVQPKYQTKKKCILFANKTEQKVEPMKSKSIVGLPTNLFVAKHFL